MDEEVLSDIPAFRIVYHHLSRRLDIFLIGHLSTAAFLDHERHVTAAIAQLRRRGVGVFTILLDLNHAAVQSQDLLQRFSGLASAANPAGRRMAVVLPANMLATLQARRTLADLPVFGERGAALAWLGQD